MVGRNAFLVLDLGLDIVDRVRRLHFEGDGLAREGFDEAGNFVSKLWGVLRKGVLHLHCNIVITGQRGR